MPNNRLFDAHRSFLAGRSAHAPTALAGASGLALGLALVCSGLTGCEDRSPSQQAVATATNEIRAAGVNAWSPDTLTKGIGSHANAASGATSQGSVSERASAALLTAQAALAQGEQQSQALTIADAEIRRTLARLNELAGLWSLKSAIAEAAESYDPSKQAAELTSSAQEKQRELGETTGRRDSFRDRIATLRADSQRALDQAKSLSDQAGSLRQQASALSAREGAPLVEQAAGLRRQGDAQRLIGEKLAAEVSVLEPQLAEQETFIQKINNQIIKLGEAKQGLDDRKAASNKEAADAREAANEINRDLEAKYAELVRLHDTDFQQAFDNAKQQFEKAASTARGASEAGPSAKLVTGNATLSVAGLQSTRLQLLSSIASTLDVLAATTPAMPKRADFQARRSQITEESTKLLEEAKGTIEQATSTFAGVQVSGDAKERMQQLTERLKRLPEQLEPPPADGVPRSARTFVEQYVAAMKEARRDELVAFVHTTNDDEKAFAEAQADVVVALKKLDDAAKAKFEVGAFELIAKAPGGQMMAQQMAAADVSKYDVSTMTFSKAGEGVNVSLPGVPTPLELVQVDGQWKTSLGQMAPMAKMITPMMKSISGAFASVAEKLEAGEFSEPSAAGTAIMQEMQKAMMGGS